jgi:hypothetical protein
MAARRRMQVTWRIASLYSNVEFDSISPSRDFNG